MFRVNNYMYSNSRTGADDRRLVALRRTKPAANHPVCAEYFLSNPAMTGLENYADIRIGHRRQWNGIQGAPVTTWVTANLPLGYSVEQAPPQSLPEEDDRETVF